MWKLSLFNQSRSCFSCLCWKNLLVRKHATAASFSCFVLLFFISCKLAALLAFNISQTLKICYRIALYLIVRTTFKVLLTQRKIQVRRKKRQVILHSLDFSCEWWRNQGHRIPLHQSEKSLAKNMNRELCEASVDRHLKKFRYSVKILQILEMF